MINTKAFKAYDIRGTCPDEVNEELAYRVGKVFCALFGAEYDEYSFREKLKRVILPEGFILTETMTEAEL